MPLFRTAQQSVLIRTVRKTNQDQDQETEQLAISSIIQNYQVVDNFDVVLEGDIDENMDIQQVSNIYQVVYPGIRFFFFLGE